MAVNLPLTGSGQTTASVATEAIGGAEYQYVKLVAGAAASTSVGAGAVIGTVGVSSGVILGAGSSANTIGTVVISSGSQTIGTVLYASASTTNTLGVMQLSSGTQQIGTVALTSGTLSLGSVVVTSGAILSTATVIALGIGSSANTIGTVVVSSVSNLNLAAGTTATYQFVQSIPFSSGNISRSSVSTTIDIQLIAANASRKSLIIANRSTAQTVGCGFSTAVLTTALANVDFYIGPSSYITLGANGNMPLYLGPIRGINLTSTAVAGSVALTEFS